MLAYKVHHQIIDFIQYNEFYMVDEIKNINEAVYYLEMRFYNLVLIYENDFKTCIKLLDRAPKKNTTAYVLLTDNTSTKFELEILQHGALDVIKNPYDKDLILARLEAIHRNNFCRNVSIDNKLFLDMEYKEVFDIDKNEVNIKGKAFDILKYLAQNEHRRVSHEELIQVVWKEPELIRNNVVEVHISLLKSELKKHFDIEFIDNVKRKGYRLIHNT
jgi:two-component system OmpR family response regulator